MAVKISNEVMNVLARCETGGNVLYLPPGQLDRKLYTEVNKVIEALGGKWNRSSKGHVFDGNAADMLESVLLTGEYHRTKQDFGQFDTPPEVVARLIELAELEPGMDVLEPSAGLGNIVRGIVGAGGVAHAFEIDPKRHAALEASGLMTFPVASGDFLTFEAAPTFDAVVMNPPFAGQADIDHVTHALKFVKPGGRLVAVMSAAVMYRDNAKTRAFRELIEQQVSGTWEELDAGAFKASGTMVRACIVAVDVRGENA